jgi:XTP/dITP diphosphohydrolase
MIQLCFATNNKHKLQEVKYAVGDRFIIQSLEELSIFEELPETHTTLEGNALQKAHYLFDKLHIPCFADDSGLEVDALNGAPGVYSARYAGLQKNSDDNINLLLKNLEGVSNRAARFRTVIALVGMGDDQLFEGLIEGEILHERRGTNGFGYDPVFKPLKSPHTFAQMSMEEKNQLSHRSIAVQKLVAYLKKLSL